jgi:hypothetical protein
MPLPLSASRWKSALNQRCGMVLILVIFRLSSRTLVALATAMPQGVPSRASNSRAMHCLQMSRQSVVSLGANLRRNSYPVRGVS